MKYKKLNEIAKVVAGQSPPSTTYNTKGEGLPFFQGKADFEDKYPNVRNWCTSKKRKEALPGDILMSVRAPVGPVNICDQKAVIGRGIAAIRPLKGVFGEYLFYFFRTHEQKIAGLGTGSTFKAITQETLKKVEVPCPSKDEQIRIATLLSRVEALINTRKENLRLLDDFLKSTFLEMFGDPARNEKGFDIRTLSEFYIDPKNGTKCGPFGSALKKNEYVKSGIPVWNMDNISTDGRFKPDIGLWINDEKYEELKAYSTINGDVIISRAGTVGKMCVLSSKHTKSIISTNLIRVRFDKGLLPVFFVSLMTFCKGRVGNLRTGADGSFTHMNTGILDKLHFPYPPVELQVQYADIVEKTEKLRVIYKYNLTELENLYGVLSQKAFKGELDLSRIPLEQVVEKKIDADIHESEVGAPFFPPLDHEMMSDPLARKRLLRQIFEDYFTREPKRSLSFSDFWPRIEFNVLDYMDEESPPLGVEDYNQIKAWLFEHLKRGEVEQTFNEHENQIKLRSKS
jgi:type I restriction enzyme S subunit